MLRRTLSTITLLAILFCTVFFGGIFGIVGLATVVTVLALFEYYRLAEHFGAAPRKAIGLLIAVVMIPAMAYGAAQNRVPPTMEIALLAGASGVILFSLYLLKSQKIPELMKQLSTLSGVLYLPFMIGFYALIVGKFGMNGAFFCVWILLATKFTDVGGLLIGCSLGKHKLAPNISPNKTWEGVAGGLIFSMLIGAGTIFAFNCLGVWELGATNVPATSVPAGLNLPAFLNVPAAPLPENFNFPVWLGALGAIPFALTSIVSDLVESVIKRRAGDKDSGNTIPGMGGALDLLDSLVLVAPVGYVVVNFVVLG